MRRGLLNQFLLVGFCALATGAIAAEESKFERIGGNFTVTRISKLSRGGFSVDFKAAEGTPKISKLHLESDHINAGLTEGDTLRLSADVLAKRGDTAEIGQVVVFLPGRVGPTPVWMLSNKAANLTPPAKLIEMHAPATDYAVF
jgi:hypothetical protein